MNDQKTLEKLQLTAAGDLRRGRFSGGEAPSPEVAKAPPEAVTEKEGLALTMAERESKSERMVEAVEERMVEFVVILGGFGRKEYGMGT